MIDGERFKVYLNRSLSKLENLEIALKEKVDNFELNVKKFDSEENQILNIKEKFKFKKIRFDVLGKKYSTTVETLVSIKDSFFYNLILNKKFEELEKIIENEEIIYLNSDPKMFNYILEFLRFKELNIQNLTKKEKEILANECRFYNLHGIKDLITEFYITPLKIENVEFNNPDQKFSKYQVVKNDFEKLNNLKPALGSSALKPSEGLIIQAYKSCLIELEEDSLIHSIDYKQISENPDIKLGTDYTVNILASLDNINFEFLQTVNGETVAAVRTIKLKRLVKAKFIKLQTLKYNFGFNYFNILGFTA